MRALVALSLANGCALAGAASFTGLGAAPAGSYSLARAVSADGTVVAGYGDVAAEDTQAFRYSDQGPMQFLGNLDMGGGSFAFGASGDGGVIVGTADIGEGSRAFRWTEAMGMASLDHFPGVALPRDTARAVSADGSIIVGDALGLLGHEAAVWTASVVTGLGDLPGGAFSSRALATSPGGETIVGAGASAPGQEAFRWTEQLGMIGMGDLPGGEFESVATGVSQGGAVIVGSGHSTMGREAFFWTAARGLVPLGELPGGFFDSEALGVSADGRVVVGYSSAGAKPAAFIWTAVSGMRPLRDVLVNDHGLDLTGWSLSYALAISADGRTIVGLGRNAQGEQESWKAVLPPHCGASLDGDGVVGAADLASMLGAWGTTDLAADLDGDGVVGAPDLALLLGAWGACPGG